MSTHNPFTVVAGKYDGEGERTFSFIQAFESLDEAIEAWKLNSNYQFNEVEYQAPDGSVWVIDLALKATA